MSNSQSRNKKFRLTFQIVKEYGEIVALEAWLKHDKDRVARARLCLYGT